MNDSQIAEKLAELEPAWAGQTNLFAAQIARGDAAALRSRLDDPLPGVRADAAEGLGQLNDVSSVARLKAMLGDREPSVARSAAIALATLGDEALGNEFIKHLNDASAKVVAGAAEALGRAKLRAAVPSLLKAYRTEHPRVGAACATALGRLGDPSAVPWLLAALKAGLAPVEAAAALGELGDASATRGLCEALTHEHPPVRAAAARSLAQLAKAGRLDFLLRDRATTALHALLRETDPRVRFCAALGLAALEDPAGVSALKTALESEPSARE